MAIHWIHTSDVHGHLDALRGIEERVERLRAEYGSANVILTDGGDCLQGSPLVYYHNHIDVKSPHIVAEAMNRMRYDCVAVGNHDIEVGHKVFDRAFGEMKFPVLCGNIEIAPSQPPPLGEGTEGRNKIGLCSEEDYFVPYVIFEKGGMRIAVLSFVTTDTTKWISPSQYEGMEFVDVKESARRWIDYVKEHEQYDMLVALCHIGWTDVKPLVEEIQDFDLVLYGHDHHQGIHRVGRTLCAAPYSLGTSFVALEIDADTHEIKAQTVNNDSQFVIKNSPDYETWLNAQIGSIDVDLREGDSYFGPSTFLTLTHQLQLAATGARISLAAPISYDAFIPHGPLRNRDVFKLYDRDSQLYTMRFTLEEIKGILEYSYSLWTSPCPSQGGVNAIRMESLPLGEVRRGILVAINSYHANGGGDVLTRGTGLNHSQLQERVVKVEPYDLRQCLANEIKKQGDIHLVEAGNWHFIPESWTIPALERDREILAL